MRQRPRFAIYGQEEKKDIHFEVRSTIKPILGHSYSFSGGWALGAAAGRERGASEGWVLASVYHTCQGRAEIRPFSSSNESGKICRVDP